MWVDSSHSGMRRGGGCRGRFECRWLLLGVSWDLKTLWFQLLCITGKLHLHSFSWTVSVVHSHVTSVPESALHVLD